MKKLILLSVLLTGCAHFTTTQTDVTYDATQKPTRSVTTRATAYTFFEGTSKLANFKAVQTDKSQTASVGDLSQQTSATNTATALGEIIGVAVGTAMKVK